MLSQFINSFAIIKGMKNLSFKLSSEQPLRMLSICPAYEISPLFRKEINGTSFWLKDESNRMGLGAFKALGGVYAVLQLIIGDDLNTSESAEISLEKIKEKAANMTFVCASAGNHGMAVAAGAKIFGAKSRIHLSATVPADFTQRLEEKGAQVIHSGENYEESVVAAIEDAETNGFTHLADGSWPGYTEPPRLVMEGYTVIAEEMRQVFEENSQWPTHVFLQAGVGGLAAAVTYMIRENWQVQPEIIIVEPDFAPCLRDSKSAGEVVTVDGPDSNMGRLDCKTASMLAFEILNQGADHYVTISDDMATRAAEEISVSGTPTTPSGVAGYAALKEYDLPENANPLVIISEGSV